MNILILPLPDPPPAKGSTEGDAILALEAATQERPLALASLLRDASPDASGRPQGVVLLARVFAGADDTAGEVIGMASARLLGDEAHVMRIAVDAAQRRRSVGRRLLDAAIAWAYAQGAVAVVLEVRAANVAAQALYAAAGFVTDGRRPRYYPDGEDALLLRRTLDAVPTAGRT
jgi:ribosomal-protein-alanine N-acetyltransferase